jgi:hypothetical protein
MTFKHTAPLKKILPDSIIDMIRPYAHLPVSAAPKRIGRQIQDAVEFCTPSSFPVTFRDQDQTFDLTKDMYEILSTQLQSNYKFFKMKKSQYLRQELGPADQSTIIQALPKELQDLNPVSVIQSVRIPGNGLIPHSDYIRTVSLFYPLITGGDWETVWYTGPDPRIESMCFGFWWPYVDFNKITEATRVKYQADQWYIFDNRSYHSVQGFKNCSNRVALGIEFRNNISANELYDILVNLDLTA